MSDLPEEPALIDVCPLCGGDLGTTAYCPSCEQFNEISAGPDKGSNE